MRGGRFGIAGSTALLDVSDSIYWRAAASPKNGAGKCMSVQQDQPVGYGEGALPVPQQVGRRTY